MPEDGTDAVKDKVKMEEYNKVVESHNNLKTEKEQLEKEMKEMKDKVVEEKKTTETKKEWAKEKVELEKQITELKKPIKKKVSKSVVQEKTPDNQTTNEVKTILDNQIPDRKLNPEKFGSRIQRYGYYKSANTKQYTSDQLGMGIDLNRGAQSTKSVELSSYAKKSKDDIIL